MSESVNTDAIRPRRWLRHAFKGALLTVVVGALVVAFSAEDVGWARLRGFPLWSAGLLFAMVGGAWICNGLRTKVLAGAFGHRLTARRAVGITLSMEFAIAATPGGVGGWVTRAYLQRRAGIPISTTLSMMAADLTADVCFFLLLAPLALRALWRLEPVRRLEAAVDWQMAGWGVAAVALALVLGLVLLGRARGSPVLRRRLGGSKLGRRLQQGFARLREELARMRTSTAFLFRRRRAAFLLSFLLAAVQWTCRYGVLAVVLWGLGVAVDPLALMLLQGTLFLVGLIVVAPGGGGALEILSSLVLHPLAGAGTAALAVVIWRLFTYHLYLVGGAVAFFHTVGRSRQVEPAAASCRDDDELPADPPLLEQTGASPH